MDDSKKILLDLIQQKGISEILLVLAEISEKEQNINATRKRINGVHKGRKSDSPIGVDALRQFMKESREKCWTADDIANNLRRFECLYSSRASFRATIASNMQKRPDIFECNRHTSPMTFCLR